MALHGALQPVDFVLEGGALVGRHLADELAGAFLANRHGAGLRVQADIAVGRLFQPVAVGFLGPGRCRDKRDKGSGDQDVLQTHVVLHGQVNTI